MVIHAGMYTTEIIQEFYKTCLHDLNPAPMEVFPGTLSLEISKIKPYLNSLSLQPKLCFQSLHEYTLSERLQEEEKNTNTCEAT